ncbi:isopenicillin N synthase family dioxygenase [Allorhizocola rhizosphaerae]|uniref:isopenicillin N synthase family dioxygenase n=1 Tax=Allorhizocola rhizosphaerae TaxID=1872709 RepID=UPI000E3CCA62|nr:2OG-Fe(II) oxygenase family protein [Allorhizocola rhizosphaerae]
MRTFHLPTTVTGSHVSLAQEMMAAWQADGIFQIATDPVQDRITQEAFAESRRFFHLPDEIKAACVSDLSYSGYAAPGEEITAGERDRSEIFTICKDVSLGDPRVEQRWPCHGPVPWPSLAYQQRMQEFMDNLGRMGEKLLRLTALGLGLGEIDALTRLTEDGWHYLRALRYPRLSEHTTRGLGTHTDYGLLVMVAQDGIGGLHVRNETWAYVKPEPGVLAVFPGDMLQFLTDGRLRATPHRVKLNTRERFSMAYFHEPNFNTVVRPLHGDGAIHYGTHFTKMFMRSFPDHPTTRQIRLDVLEELRFSPARRG